MYGRKGRSSTSHDLTKHGHRVYDIAACFPIIFFGQGESCPVPALAPLPAPFGSVGETAAARATSSPSPFSAGMERELDMFVMSRPQDRDDGGNTAAVREAQRRARRRALLQRKLDAAAGGGQRANASEVSRRVYPFVT